MLIIDNPDLSSYISRNCPDIQKEVAPKIEGIENMSKLTRDTKIKMFLGGVGVEQDVMPIDDVVLY